jgi:hypothetical protein
VTKDKYLVLKGCAGLGNRLMTICSAIEYCKKTNRKLVIDWSDGVFAEKGVNIFHRFFKINNFSALASLDEVKSKIKNLSCYPEVFKKDIEVDGYGNFVHAHNPFFLIIPKRLLFNERLKMLHGFWLDKSKDHKSVVLSKWKFMKEIFDRRNMPLGVNLDPNRMEDVVFYFDFTPNNMKDSFLRYISLQEDIIYKINSYVLKNKLTENTIGIHIRNTDKQPQKSLDELYKKLANIKLNSPIYFLATDNKQVSSDVKNKLSPVVECRKMMPDLKSEGMHQWAKYNNQAHLGVQILEESIVDMWILSKCEYLLYQGNSTFSKLSMFMNINTSKTLAWDE